MRAAFQGRTGERLYVFTTFGAVFEGVLVQVDNQIVELLAPDRRTTMRVNLDDVSSVRAYDETEES